jgi:hypothetical protein
LNETRRSLPVMPSAAQSKHLYLSTNQGHCNEAVEMLRLRCAALSMTDGFS